MIILPSGFTKKLKLTTPCSNFVDFCVDIWETFDVEIEEKIRVVNVARKKQADVQIRETANDTAEHTELEVLINDQVIGQVTQIDETFYEASYQSGNKIRLQSVEEAVEFLIMEYNLHDM